MNLTQSYHLSKESFPEGLGVEHQLLDSEVSLSLCDPFRSNCFINSSLCLGIMERSHDSIKKITAINWLLDGLFSLAIKGHVSIESSSPVGKPVIDEVVITSINISTSKDCGIRKLGSNGQLSLILCSQPFRSPLKKYFLRLSSGVDVTKVNKSLDSHLLANSGKSGRSSDIDIIVTKIICLNSTSNTVDDYVRVGNSSSDRLLIFQLKWTK